VKLADRLHNMQTIHYIKDPEKRRRIALETLEIYAPLAERMGMHEIKDQLENLAFAQVYPEAYASIVQRLSFLREQGTDLADQIIAELGTVLTDAGVQCTVSGREKTPYSIWRKMQKKRMEFEQLSDIMAFRITVDDVTACYQALGVIHSHYSMIPGRFKDYISTPKPNNYRSLHTGVIGPLRNRIEIQIRTSEMHEVAELGVAAHWQYKQGHPPQMEGRQYRWLRELLDILEHAAGPEEFLENTKLEMFQDQVFCFTPKGDLIALPRGATPVDFAYAVHTEVGNTCVGAKINGRIVPLRSELHNGDQVEVVNSRAQTPSPTWERFVVTGKARACIRRFIRTQQRAQYIELGRAMIQKEFQHEGYEYADKSLDGVLKKFKAEESEDLLAQVGEGMLGAREVVNAIFPGTRAKTAPDKVVPINRQRSKAAKGGNAIPIRGLIPGMAMHFAGCCHPLPGDRIVGIVTTGKGVTIHTIDCETLESFAETPERWLDVAWDQDPNATDHHVGRLSVVITNQPGSLGSLTTVIGKNLGNISNLKITNRSIDFFEVLVDVEVKDVRHLTNIIAALRATPAISSVDRARG